MANWTNKTKSGQTEVNLWSPNVRPWQLATPWLYDFAQFITFYINKLKN